MLQSFITESLLRQEYCSTLPGSKQQQQEQEEPNNRVRRRVRLFSSRRNGMIGYQAVHDIILILMMIALGIGIRQRNGGVWAFSKSTGWLTTSSSSNSAFRYRTLSSLKLQQQPATAFLSASTIKNQLLHRPTISSTPFAGVSPIPSFQLHKRSLTLKASSTTTTTTTTDTTTTTESTTTNEDDCPPASSILQYDRINQQRGLGDKYDPKSFEKAIYEWYERTGCFQPRSDRKESGTTTTKKRVGKSYVLPMPPPNVTGKLHMGHAIFVALQDILARYHRMRGRNVLWTPGTDHAGIATQLQVEKLLLAEGTTRQQIGRDQFLQRVWEYKKEQGGFITQQLRTLGASADWSRERFTMDTSLSQSVIEAFVLLHDRNLIYKGEYMVNWAPLLQTAVSDLEVEYTDEVGKLYYFKYVLEGDNEDEYIPVATTRPETIMGDTAVCVNPNDERYQKYIGKNVIVPMSGGRTIPVIADQYVDIEFGTGALKITPGHDPNDYTLGKKYNLPIINIMNKDGTMNNNAGTAYVGLDRFECRTKLWHDMETAGLTIRVQENHMQRIPRSQRGGEIIEPMVSRQWFCRTDNMAKKAIEAVENGTIQIIPNRFEKIWYNWLNDNRDWCISRQLWWGHRIPVWYILTNAAEDDSTDNAPYVVARDENEARTKVTELGYDLESVTLKQEDDVLDTWFSSGLWPFATVGWPHGDITDPNSDYNKFYPATCLETGYDILFFWVARMVMMGIELTGKSPFEVVYLHGLVRAADGSKMSKTKGNVIDPIDTVEQYGADSLRYSLVTGVTPGQDIPLNMEKIETNRNFANKLWNCCKFVTGNALKGITDTEREQLAVQGPITEDELAALALPERYIISQCHKLVTSVTSDIENYQLGAAGSKVYEFLWDEFADWYIEISKTRLYDGAGGSGTASIEAQQARRVLVYVLDTSLRLLHPYMPYVTEQLWHHLPRVALSTEDNLPNALMLADWPQLTNEDGTDEVTLATDTDAVRQFECFQTLTRKIRNARAEYNVEPGKRISAYVVAPPGPMKDSIHDELKSLIALAKLDPSAVAVYETGSPEAQQALGFDDANTDLSTKFVQLIVQDGVEAYLPLSNLIDPVKEQQRVQRELNKITKEVTKLQDRLNSKGFVDKAPADLVAKAQNELAELQAQQAKLQTTLDTLLSETN